MTIRGHRISIQAIIGTVLAILSVVCVLLCLKLSDKLDSQKAAERWQGDGELRFSQISCYLPADEKVNLEQIYTFRNDLGKKFHEAALDIGNDRRLFNDCWYATGKVKVSRTGGGKGDVAVTAVGGGFFDFHPLTLISGSYIRQEDLMQDRAVLDEETAWLLFGGTDLTGMSFEINGKPFVVAGVIRRETDRVSRKAYTSGMGIYMSYDAFVTLEQSDTESESTVQTVSTAVAPEKIRGISGYELVAAEPVKGFAYSAVNEKFPIGGGVIINNSDRFDFVPLVKLVGEFGTRSMQTHGVIYPYWENAARYTEDWCCAYLIAALLLAVYPILLLILTAVKYGGSGKEKLTEHIIPELKEKTGERIRAAQRRRWERKHPGWKD